MTKKNDRVMIRAIIKYNRMDKQNVVYFQGNGRIYKMLSPKHIQRMSWHNFGSMINIWINNKSKMNGIVVYDDEQVNYEGKALDVPARLVKLSKHLADYAQGVEI